MHTRVGPDCSYRSFSTVLDDQEQKVELAEYERGTLQNWARRLKPAQVLALRQQRLRTVQRLYLRLWPDLVHVLQRQETSDTKDTFGA